MRGSRRDGGRSEWRRLVMPPRGIKAKPPRDRRPAPTGRRLVRFRAAVGVRGSVEIKYAALRSVVPPRVGERAGSVWVAGRIDRPTLAFFSFTDHQFMIF
jgi:hypothetical protein